MHFTEMRIVCDLVEKSAKVLKNSVKYLMFIAVQQFGDMCRFSARGLNALLSLLLHGDCARRYARSSYNVMFKILVCIVRCHAQAV